MCGSDLFRYISIIRMFMCYCIRHKEGKNNSITMKHQRIVIQLTITYILVDEVNKNANISINDEERPKSFSKIFAKSVNRKIFEKDFRT